jgi:hypothetical protein
MAPKRFQVVLAMEIPTNRQAKDPTQSSEADLGYGAAQPDLGTGSHRKRTLCKARNSSLASNHPEILAERAKRRSKASGFIPAMDDLCPQSRAGHAGLRFLCVRNGKLSGRLCVCHHGNSHATTCPLQCYCPSHRSLDCAAISGGHQRPTGLPTPDSRSRQHLLPGVGSCSQRYGSPGAQDSLPFAPGEFLLRTPDRKPAPGLSGFSDSHQ